MNNEKLDVVFIAEFQQKIKHVRDLVNQSKEKDGEISFLKSKTSDLKDTLEYWQKNLIR